MRSRSSARSSPAPGGGQVHPSGDTWRLEPTLAPRRSRPPQMREHVREEHRPRGSLPSSPSRRSPLDTRHAEKSRHGPGRLGGFDRGRASGTLVGSRRSLPRRRQAQPSASPESSREPAACPRRISPTACVLLRPRGRLGNGQRAAPVGPRSPGPCRLQSWLADILEASGRSDPLPQGSRLRRGRLPGWPL